MEKTVLHLLNGISYGMVLFLIADGLSLVLGLMGVVNLSHGVIFIFGGLVGLVVAKATGSFLLAVVAGAAASGVAGLIVERAFLRFLYRQDLQQVLVTFGLIYIGTNLLLVVFGPNPRGAFIPAYLAGVLSIGSYPYPVYRVAIIFVGLAIAIGLWWLQDKTRTGAIIRAGMDDAEMASGLGINLTPYNTAIFAFGSALAGAGAVIGVQLFGRIGYHDGMDILLPAIGVVIIGGVGSVQGALVGALLIGIINTFGNVYFPALSQFIMYLVMILVLMVRPSGIMGRRL